MDPEIQPNYKKHVFICTGSSCAPEGAGEKLFQWFKEKLRQKNLHEGDGRIRRSKTTCLGICEQGPVGVVYPEGVWYGQLNEEKLEKILEEHLVGNKPVQECMLFKMDKK